MRKLLLFTLVATLFTACTEDVIDEQRNVLTDDNRTLTVSLDGDANNTRIQLTEEKKTVWTEGDLLSVFYRSTTNEQWQFMGKTGDRTGNVEPVDSSIIPTPTTNDIVVVYPYNAGYFYNSNTKSVQASLPATQSYLKDSYGLDGNIMVSLSEYNQVALKSVCGWLKLQLTGNGEKIKSITLRGNNGEQVAGELYINSADATSTLASKLTESDDDSEVGGTLVRPGTILTEVTLEYDEGVVLGAEATAFYIALPPQTFANGLTVEITATNGLVMTKSTDNSIVIERNHIQPMTTFVYDGVRPQPNNEIWYTATAKVEPYDKTVFGATYHSNVWDSETGKGVITFEGDVTEIGYYAFRSRDSLTSVTIPDSVTTIGEYAFYSCNSLTSVTIPDSVTTIGERAFYDCDSLKEFKGKFAADGGRCLIVDGVLNAFALGCGVTQYTIPDSVTEIGESAFYWCDSLTSVTIPDSVTTIGEKAFYNCKSLISVTIGDSVTTIGIEAFGFCGSLTSVIIPDSVTTIGESAFYVCTSLTSVTIGDSVTTIGYEAFSWCNSLTSVTIPDSVTTIGGGAFSYCKSLTSVTIPDSVTTIGERVFCVCERLTSVTIPDSVTTIGESAFSFCTSLESVTIDNSITTIGKSAFQNCTSLTSVTIGNSVTTIGKSAFQNCTSLTSVTIPDSVTTIGYYAFDSCYSLKTVYCKRTTPPTGGYDMFDYNASGRKIYVPASDDDSIINAYKAKKYWSDYADYIFEEE